jgi:hemoglobin-like flavoprotein
VVSRPVEDGAREIKGMDEAQKELVRATFARIAPIADQAGAMLYEKMFALDPDLRRLFKIDIETQGAKLMAVFATAIANLHRLDEILPKVRELGRRHVAFGVKDNDYDTGGVALVQTLEGALGDAFTPAARSAWMACYEAVVGEMKAGAAAERVASPALVD